MFPEWPSSSELIAELAERHEGRCILSFSAGKDSVATWLALRPHFPHILPVYGYSPPGLRLVEEGLVYYERFFKTRIVRLPHPSLHRLLNAALFQYPETEAIIRAADLPEHSWDDLFAAVRIDYELPATTPVMARRAGGRLTDSPDVDQEDGPGQCPAGASIPRLRLAGRAFAASDRRGQVPAPG